MKTIMISSALFGEGKTFVASNLAISFANSKDNTLLIDGDMRKGKLSKVFGYGGDKKGLSNVLEGNISLDEAIRKIYTEQDPKMVSYAKGRLNL